MADWLVEEGIGEERAILLEGDTILAARVQWPGGLLTGMVTEAALIRRYAGSATGIVRFAGGEEGFASLLPRDLTEGARVRVEITREAMAERGRLKRAQARRSTSEPRPAPTLAQALGAEGHQVQVVRRFPTQAAWNELLDEAREGSIGFTGGALLIALTPAMTLIDVDANYHESVYHNALPALARALRRMDIGGNIGIDFPTVRDKDLRRMIDDRLGEYLASWPHERTAINGFGFVQIVTRLQHPSLLQRLALYPAQAAARQLLRRAEMLEGAGMIELTAHPAVLARLTGEWLDQLRRRSGRDLVQRADPALAIGAAHAQLIAR